jgi:hypothetical protein
VYNRASRSLRTPAPRRAQRRTLGDVGRHHHNLSRIVEWDGTLDDLRLQRGSEDKAAPKARKEPGGMAMCG